MIDDDDDVIDYFLGYLGYGFKGQNDLYFTQYASLVPAGVL